MTKIREIIDCVTPLKKGVALDTLAQLDHIANNTPPKNARQTLTNRAIAKYYTNEILYPLIDLKNTREKAYWNTFHCVRLLQQDTEGTIRSKYCKNRWCIVCDRIRSAIMINGYEPVIKNWKETRFLTLTIPNVKLEDLKDSIEEMQHKFTVIWRRVKRRFKGTKMLRKIEITWSYRRQDYHPHFHVILNDSNVSRYFIQEWLKEFPTADIKGQNEKEADSNKLIELFKYMTKMWKTLEATDTQLEKKVLPYPPEIMDNIFAVMRGKRVIQTYGGIKAVDEDFDNDKATVHLDEIRENSSLWIWEQDVKTWVDIDTGELRT